MSALARAPCCSLLPTHLDQGKDTPDRISNVEEYLQNIQAIKPVPESNVSDSAELHLGGACRSQESRSCVHLNLYHSSLDV